MLRDRSDRPDDCVNNTHETKFKTKDMARPTTIEAIEKTYSFQKKLFNQVIEKYNAIRQLSPVVSSNLNTISSRSHRLSYTMVDYLIDVEHACTAALENKPQLHGAFAQLVADDPVDLQLAKQVIRSVATVFNSRNLDPAIYFLKYRRGRGERHE